MGLSHQMREAWQVCTSMLHPYSPRFQRIVVDYYILFNYLVCLCNSPLDCSCSNSTWNQGEGYPGTVREVEIIDMVISFFPMIIISTSILNCARTTFASASCRSLVTFQEQWNGLLLSDPLHNNPLQLIGR